MSDKQWFHEIKWDSLTKEHTEYTLNEANVALKTSLESCKELDTKSFYIITGSLVYISVLLPFIFKATEDIFFIPASLLVCGFFVALLMLVHSIKAQKYFPMGNYPSNTLNLESLKGDYLNFLHWEIVSRQEWIAHNEKVNKLKGRLINLSLISLLSSVALAFIVYMFIRHSPL